MNPWFPKRSTLGAVLGLLVLVLAFAYRWGAWPVRDDDAGDGDGVVQQEYQPHPASASSQGIANDTAMDLSLGPPEAPTTDTDDDDDSDATPGDLAEDVRADLTEALARARAARGTGRLVFPVEDNAVTWYDRALELDPDNRAAQRGRRRALDEAIEFANTALDAGDLKTADVWMKALAEVDGVAEDLGGLTTRVANLPRVETLLREGAQRVAANLHFEPAGSSALDSYRAALAVDPRNGAAKQGLREIEQAVLTRALAAAAGEQFADAERLLDLAAHILPGTQAQLEARSRVVDLRQARGRALLDRVATALSAREVERASELLARARAFGVDSAEVARLDALIANARIYDHNNPGEVFADAFVDREGSGPRLVVVPIGRFRMGSPNSERGREEREGPQHAVEMPRPFALARDEVTVAQFRRFVRDADYRTDAERVGNSAVYDNATGRIANRAGVTWRHDYVGADAADNLPVVHVSWNDARAYADWLTQRTGKPYRLPSEAEFEYVLRAGTTSRYWWGAGNPTTVRGNYTGALERSPTRRSWSRAFPRYDDGFWGPAPAGSFAANPWGVRDLDGNVAEWVEDCWHDSYLRAPETGVPWVNPGCDRRVVRGGSWGSAPEQMRSAYRQGSGAAVRGSRIGFRVARDL